MSKHQSWMFGVPDQVTKELDRISSALDLTRPNVAKLAIAIGTKVLQGKLTDHLSDLHRDPEIASLLSQARALVKPIHKPVPDDWDAEALSVAQVAKLFSVADHEVRSWMDSSPPCPSRQEKAPYMPQPMYVLRLKDIVTWLNNRH